MTDTALRWDITCGQRKPGYWVAWCTLEGAKFGHVPYVAEGESERAAKANLHALLLMAVAPRGKA